MCAERRMRLRSLYRLMEDSWRKGELLQREGGSRFVVGEPGGFRPSREFGPSHLRAFALRSPLL